ncbi:hypothetical protein HPB47_011924 [Ixodes persulcatus]|uniref:Uncharacterized protein n=1 Tax=Ixodes persulcatus TaxID=34615 RepID=A0AC60NV21_IXOPE|nr:hypothetical protein HPB47_011924 [Ixodes persulcatus]
MGRVFGNCGAPPTTEPNKGIGRVSTLGEKIKETNGSAILIQKFVAPSTSNSVSALVFGSLYDCEDRRLKGLVENLEEFTKALGTGIMINLFPNRMKAIIMALPSLRVVAIKHIIENLIELTSHVLFAAWTPAGDTRTALERRQREVGSQALGCHGTVANEAVQGDLGWSSFEAREATSKVSYDGRLRLMDRCRWAKRLFVYTHMTSLQSRWRKRLYQLEKNFGFFTEPVEATTEKEWESVVRKTVREQENVQWLESARTKSTLTMYAELKQQMTAETRLYDDSLGSRLLFEARAGALRTLVYKQRFDNSVQSTVCRVCEGESETSEHIILRCGGIRPSATSPTEEANRLHEGVPPLATALGFSTTSERAGTTEAFWKTIEQTKRRLEDWWHYSALKGVV